MHASFIGICMTSEKKLKSMDIQLLTYGTSRNKALVRLFLCKACSMSTYLKIIIKPSTKSDHYFIAK
jgi:hypothetical protein